MCSIVVTYNVILYFCGCCTFVIQCEVYNVSMYCRAKRGRENIDMVILELKQLHSYALRANDIFVGMFKKKSDIRYTILSDVCRMFGL